MKQALDKQELNAFFSCTFGEDVFLPHEMRLSPAEACYLQSQYFYLRLTPLSPTDSMGKTWFKICPEGAAV